MTNTQILPGPRCYDRCGVFAKQHTQKEHIPSDKSELRHERGVLCASCSVRLTAPSYAYAYAGAHTHIKTNPEGVTFIIHTYSRADNCLIEGTGTLMFTWFEGYYWKYCLCASCGSHLGWYYYHAQQGNSFYGLMKESILFTG